MSKHKFSMKKKRKTEKNTKEYFALFKKKTKSGNK